MPSAHVYTSHWVYVGDYNSYDRHAKVCTDPYHGCSYYITSHACNPIGDIWISTIVIGGVHSIYRECSSCGIGVQIGSATHYSNRGCRSGCNG